MSRSMQTKILEELEKIGGKRGLETVINYDYSNVLTLLYQPKSGFNTVLEAHLSFQTTYLTGTITHNGTTTEILKTDYNDSNKLSAFFKHFLLVRP